MSVHTAKESNKQPFSSTQQRREAIKQTESAHTNSQAKTQSQHEALTHLVIDPHSIKFDYYQQATLHQAQLLRTKCFHAEFGVLFDNDLDADEFDEACLHIVVLKGEQVIATSRLLDSQRASMLGRFYSDGEFYMQDFLRAYPYNILEVGRTCIHPDFRGIRVMMYLWRTISKIADQVNANAFMGCCSIPIGAGDVNAWLGNLTVPKIDVKPKHRLPLSLLASVLPESLVTPPLFDMYLRMGASVSHQACFDPDFHCADVLVWLPFEQMKPKFQSFLR